MLLGMLKDSPLAQIEIEAYGYVFGPRNSECMTSRFVGRETEARSTVGDYLH
jgi:hypothetical protein